MFEVTNLPFRLLCKEFGATASITEFISVNQLLYVFENNIKETNSVKYMLQTNSKEKPVGLQLFGFDAEHFKQLFKIFNVQDYGFDFLDLNIGCPVPKICATGSGSRLLGKDKFSNLESILKTISNSITEPFSIKIRSGYKEPINVQKYAELFNSIDLLMITIHPKLASVSNKKANVANHEFSKTLIELVDHPVVINGGIYNLDYGNELREKTNADGIMIGRKAQKYPWIFSKSYQESVPINIYIGSMLELLDLTAENGYGKLYMIRDQILSFIRGFKGSKLKRTELQIKLDSLDILYNFVHELERYLELNGVEYINNIIPKLKKE